MGLVYRLFAALLCLGLIAGNAAVCAGWAATPEERMACCAEGGECPMHKGAPHHAGSARVMTQAQADACCAASERIPSSSANPVPVAMISVPLLGAGVVLPATMPALVLRDGWRTAVPMPGPPVPRHVLLSIFLV